MPSSIARPTSHSHTSEVAELSVSEWSYIGDEQKRRYIGPMAEDFWDTFGLGSPDGTLSAADTAGVALAAIKGLKAESDAKDKKIAALEAKVTELAAVVRALAASNQIALAH